MHPAYHQWKDLERDPTELKTRGGKTLDTPCLYSATACYKADATAWVETAQIWTQILARLIGPEAKGLQVRAGLLGYAAKSRAYVDTVLEAMELALEASLAVDDVLHGRPYDPEATDLEAADIVSDVALTLGDAIADPVSEGLKRADRAVDDLIPDWLGWIPLAAVLALVAAAVFRGDE